MAEMPNWLHGLTEKDWMLDGQPIRSKYQRLKWSKLDWSRAWMDMGPSPAGNLGPYWHVPWDFDGEELWARLYPKLILSKWLSVTREACRAVATSPEKYAALAATQHI